MSEKNKQQNTALCNDEMPKAAPLNDPDIRGSYSERSKRIFLRVSKSIGILVCAAAVMAPVVKQVDTIVAANRWQNDSMEVQYVPAVEGTPAAYKKEAYIAFPGVGQKDTMNAATEHFRAINDELPAAYVSLPNQGFTIEELAHEVDDLIDEKGLEKINIIGVSAGTQLALQTITYIEEHPDEFIDVPGDDPLPEVGYFLANSSPYNVMSAYKGPIIQPTITTLETTGYRSGVAEKFIYSLVDGPGDVNKLLSSTLPPIDVRYIAESITQTFNDTAPLMVQDHLTILKNFNADEQKSNWQKVLTPTAKFLYFYPSKGQDMVVDNQWSYRQFSVELQELDVSSEYVPIDSNEHANTVGAAAAFGQWLLTLQQPNNATFNPYPEESIKPFTS